MLSALLVFSIALIVGLSVAFSSQHSAMAMVRLCPEGMSSRMLGDQVECLSSEVVSQNLPYFDTYGASPEGDTRRMKIAQRGFNPDYYYNLVDEGMQ